MQDLTRAAMLKLTFTPTPCMVDSLEIAQNQETWNGWLETTRKTIYFSIVQ